MDLFKAQYLHSMLKHREFAYKNESDPLMIKVQLGQISKEDWEAKRQEIKDRYPYPSDIVKEDALDFIDRLMNGELTEEEQSLVNQQISKQQEELESQVTE